jgi:hypothetical protein
MPSKRTRAAAARGTDKKRVASSTQVRYCKSVANSAGALLDPTGRAASATYAVRRETRPSAAETIAKDWSSVGRTLSNAFADVQVRRTAPRRR